MNVHLMEKKSPLTGFLKKKNIKIFVKSVLIKKVSMVTPHFQSIKQTTNKTLYLHIQCIKPKYSCPAN